MQLAMSKMVTGHKFKMAAAAIFNLVLRFFPAYPQDKCKQTSNFRHFWTQKLEQFSLSDYLKDLTWSSPVILDANYY